MKTKIPGTPESTDVAKAQAKRLRTALNPALPIVHGQALELIAKVHGRQSWGHLEADLQESASEPPKQPEPIGWKNKSELDENHLESRSMLGLVDGLRKARPTLENTKSRAKLKNLIHNQLVRSIEIEEYCDTLDVSMGGMIFDVGSENLIRIAGVNRISRFPRPKKTDKEVYGSGGITLAGFGSILIFLERLGFDTHPGPVVDAVNAQIGTRKFLDDDELHCFWYETEKRRVSTRSFGTSPAVTGDLQLEKFKTRTGSSVEIWASPKGQVQTLLVTTPKGRLPRSVS